MIKRRVRVCGELHKIRRIWNRRVRLDWFLVNKHNIKDMSRIDFRGWGSSVVVCWTLGFFVVKCRSPILAPRSYHPSSLLPSLHPHLFRLLSPSLSLFLSVGGIYKTCIIGINLTTTTTTFLTPQFVFLVGFVILPQSSDFVYFYRVYLCLASYLVPISLSTFVRSYLFFSFWTLLDSNYHLYCCFWMFWCVACCYERRSCVWTREFSGIWRRWTRWWCESSLCRIKSSCPWDVLCGFLVLRTCQQRCLKWGFEVDGCF